MMARIAFARFVGVMLAVMSVLSAGTAESQSSFYSRSKDRIKFPSPIGYVSDHAQVLDPEWKERIRSVCQDLERKTGVEMVVVTVPSIAPVPSVFEYATALYEQWKIGSTQQEHGVMVLVAVQERQAAITLGRRMIPVITPEIRKQVGSTYLSPAIQLGHFGEGLNQTVVALAASAQEVRVGELRKTHLKGLGFWLTIMLTAVAIAAFWFISRPDRRQPYPRLQKGEYWGTGQGGFGGNWGGFGGGTSGEGWR